MHGVMKLLKPSLSRHGCYPYMQAKLAVFADIYGRLNFHLVRVMPLPPHQMYLALTTGYGYVYTPVLPCLVSLKNYYNKIILVTSRLQSFRVERCLMSSSGKFYVVGVQTHISTFC